MSIRNDISVNFEVSPRIITVAAPSTELTMQDLVDTCRLIEENPNNMDNQHLVNASGKENLGGGVLVGITVELQNAQVAFEARDTETVASSASAADPNGITLTIATSSFDSVTVGATIYNITKRSIATVISVDSGSQISHSPLEDGIDSEWSISDEFEIYNIVRCSITGGNLVAVDSTGSIISAISPTAFTQINLTASSSATIAELEIQNLQRIIEFQRNHHSGTGNIWYWDPYAGSDSLDGTAPTRAVKTFAKAHDLVEDNNHDIIICVPGDPTGVTVSNENMIITKNYLFVRGPGRDFHIRPTTTNPSSAGIDVQGNGVEISSMFMGADNAGPNADCIKVTGDFFLLKDAWVNDSTGNGVVYEGSENSIIEYSEISGNAEDGVAIIGNVTNFSGEKIHIENNGKNGLHFSGTGNSHCEFESGAIDHNGEYGILIESGTEDVHISKEVRIFENTLGSSLDFGTGTYIELEDSVTPEIQQLKYAVESLRDTFSGYGDIYYWDPTNGDDNQNGKTPEKAVKTFSKAHTLVTSNNFDIIYAIAGGVSSTTIVDENIEITKNFVSLRGPGLNFSIQSTTAPSSGYMVNIEGEGVELQGMEIKGNYNSWGGIRAAGNKFTMKGVLSRRFSTNEALFLDNSHRAWINDCSFGYAPNGVKMSGGTEHIFFRRNFIDDCTGDGILITGVTTHEINIEDSNSIITNGGYGINIQDGAYRIIVDDTILFSRNELGEVNDEGGSDNLFYGTKQRIILDGGVKISTTEGLSGTYLPIGSIQIPSNNLTDSRIIADFYHLKKYDITGAATLNADHIGWNFHGDSEDAKVNLAGFDVDNSHFEDVTVSGQCNGAIHARHCRLEDAVSLSGTFENCGLSGTITIISGDVDFIDCNSLIPGTSTPILDSGVGVSNNMNIRGYNGGLQLNNVDQASQAVSVDLNSGHLVLDSSCTAGIIVVRGTGHLTDNSAGSTVVKTGLVSINNIWDETASDHTTIDTMGRKLNDAGGGSSPVDIANQVWNTALTQFTSAGTAGELMSKLLGLVLENTVEDDIVLDGNGDKISCSQYHYDSAANAITHDKATGLKYKYDLVFNYDANGRLNFFRLIDG